MNTFEVTRKAVIEMIREPIVGNWDSDTTSVFATAKIYLEF